MWAVRERISESLGKAGAVYKYDISLPVEEKQSMIEKMQDKVILCPRNSLNCNCQMSSKIDFLHRIRAFREHVLGTCFFFTHLLDNEGFYPCVLIRR